MSELEKLRKIAMDVKNRKEEEWKLDHEKYLDMLCGKYMNDVKTNLEENALNGITNMKIKLSKENIDDFDNRKDKFGDIIHRKYLAGLMVERWIFHNPDYEGLNYKVILILDYVSGDYTDFEIVLWY